ncbi:MAG: aminopeptidase P N-terminal domain-containing protein [Candidatus Korobacteraceae bacterium]
MTCLQHFAIFGAKRAALLSSLARIQSTRKPEVHLRKLAAAFVFFLLLAPLCALERQPNADYRARRQRLAQKAGANVVLVFAATEDSQGIEPYSQDENYYYLTGLRDPGGAVLVAGAISGPPYTEILFLPTRNRAEERWTGPKLGPDTPDAKQRTGFDRILPLHDLPRELAGLIPQPDAQALSSAGTRSRPKVYIDTNRNTEEPLAWLRRTNALVAATTDDSPLLESLRMVKDAGEIDLIRKATDASMAAHVAAMKAMRPGVSEREIGALMQYEFMKRGCEGPGYPLIVGAGFNSTVLHYSENSATVDSGDVVVMDIGCQYSAYITDITRTLPATGKFTARQREIYDIVLGAQRAAVAAFRSGKSTLGREGEFSLYDVAYQYINTHGKDRNGKPLGQYFIHGLGHHVGLNVHDPAEAGRTLEPGMVFTIEPGIYIPEENIGIRIEDMFYVATDGTLVELTASLPRSADEVERAMGSGRTGP